jgi:hypothetical protein
VTKMAGRLLWTPYSKIPVENNGVVPEMQRCHSKRLLNLD